VSFAGLGMTIVAFVVILTAVALPLGSYLAKVYGRRSRVPLTDPRRARAGSVLRVLRADSEAARQELEGLRQESSDLSRWAGLAAPVSDPTHAERPSSCLNRLNPLGYHSAPWNVTFNTVSSFVTNNETGSTTAARRR